MASSLRRSFKRPLHSRHPAPPPTPRGMLGNGRFPDEAVLELVEFQITEEPLDDPTMRRLSQRDQDRILEAGYRVMEGAKDQAPILEQLVQEFPNIPKIYNYLMVAYRNAGRYAQVEEWAEKTYHRFPTYLFGMVNYAHWLLGEGRLQEVTEILDGRFSLHLWIRNRRMYHVSEFAAFTGLMVSYFTVLGEDEVADRYYRMLREIAPDHPAIQEIARFRGRGILRSLLRRLARSPSDTVAGKNETKQHGHGRRQAR